MQGSGRTALAMSSAQSPSTAKWSPSAIWDLIVGAPHEDDFFVFAGKIYRRREPPVSLLRFLRSHALLVLPLIIGLSITASVALRKPLLAKIGASRARDDSSQTAKKGTKSGAPKIIRLTHASRASNHTIFRLDASRQRPKMNGELDEISKAMAAFASTSNAQDSSVPDELKQLSAAMKSLAAANKASKLSLSALEAKRKHLIRSKAAEFRREYEDLVADLLLTEVEKNHPLLWKNVQSSTEELVQRAASAVSLLKTHTICSRCDSESSVDVLSSRRRTVLRDIVNRSVLQDELEKIILYSLTQSERPEEVFDEENTLRIVEGVHAKWSAMSRSKFVTDVLFSDEFDEFCSIDLKQSSLDTIFLKIEACLIRRGASNSRVSCGIVKGDKLYGLRGQCMSSFASTFDCIVDAVQGIVYLNKRTLGSVERRSILAVLTSTVIPPQQHEIVGAARKRETSLRNALSLEDKYSEVYAMEVPLRLVEAIERKPGKTLEAIRTQLRLPAKTPIMVSLIDSVCSGVKTERNFTSPTVASAEPAFICCISRKGLESGATVALVFVRDRALCGCILKKAMEKAVGA